MLKGNVEGRVFSPPINYDAEEFRISTTVVFIICELPFELVGKDFIGPKYVLGPY